MVQSRRFTEVTEVETQLSQSLRDSDSEESKQKDRGKEGRDVETKKPEK